MVAMRRLGVSVNPIWIGRIRQRLLDNRILEISQPQSSVVQRAAYEHQSNFNPRVNLAAEIPASPYRQKRIRHRRPDVVWTRGPHWFIVSTMSNSVVTASPDVMSGAPVFPGIRVPVRTLLEYLEAGDSIGEFLRGFPSVSRSQVVAFLERAATLAVTDAA
jgi:uncharacterized protein (DUF433 family)